MEYRAHNTRKISRRAKICIRPCERYRVGQLHVLRKRLLACAHRPSNAGSTSLPFRRLLIPQNLHEDLRIAPDLILRLRHGYRWQLSGCCEAWRLSDCCFWNHLLCNPARIRMGGETTPGICRVEPYTSPIAVARFGYELIRYADMLSVSATLNCEDRERIVFQTCSTWASQIIAAQRCSTYSRRLPAEHCRGILAGLANTTRKIGISVPAQEQRHIRATRDQQQTR
ncbi:hypothetical protein K431DRAFT_136897 [Polychaeton citri CBS 116435]|uniref:Uncharacterized protein n=1 Tax=Polychaeton citri CBS 116435 TaxID=1314669 RepID=A0A9P4Q310_9PEZI|nr:hypothetical protein K431DRAFT_136897 [Polychaeton citri CBS 116435]